MIQPTSLFLITSAINTRFGVFTKDERLTQTIASIKSVQEKMPSAEIRIIECSAGGICQYHRDQLSEMNVSVIEFKDDQTIKYISQSDNWDLVKNYTEMLCTLRVISELTESQWERIYKLSGRYTLTDDFDSNAHQNITVARSVESQFSQTVTGVPRQYMSRLWSWDTILHQYIVDVYANGIKLMAEKISEGLYIDIEHILFKFLPRNYVNELDVIGVSGNLGPNGKLVKD